MSFFGDLFNKKHTESVVLIDIGADSVAGGHAVYAEGDLPAILYSRRLPIEVREGEPHQDAMLRALDLLGASLVREGAPVLLRATGSGRSDAVLVSVDAPWQTTTVRTERFEQKQPFIFTKSLVREAMEKTATPPAGQLLADESIIGTILNGYETREPYGKEVSRASIIILSSFIDENVVQGIQSSLRSLYHTKNILSIAGSSLRYQAMRIAFPHERDALILDATGPMTTIALVRRDLLVDVIEVSAELNDADSWLQKVSEKLAEVAGRFPLPRTIFLLAREPDLSSLQETLAAGKLSKLWLSDNPPRIVAVQGSHIGSAIRQATTGPSDLPLLLMALFWQYRHPEESSRTTGWELADRSGILRLYAHT